MHAGSQPVFGHPSFWCHLSRTLVINMRNNCLFIDKEILIDFKNILMSLKL
jgi:hypothetical protein